MMKLQFDANQDYQLEAIRAVVALFEGQPDSSQTSVTRDDELSSLKLTETGVANQRVITDEHPEPGASTGRCASWSC